VQVIRKEIEMNRQEILAELMKVAAIHSQTTGLSLEESLREIIESYLIDEVEYRK